MILQYTVNVSLSLIIRVSGQLPGIVLHTGFTVLTGDALHV